MLFANMGVPIVCVAVPIMLIALLPIALVESIVYCRFLRRPFKDAFWGALVANLWSTLVGVPFVWLLVLVVQLCIGGGSAWGMETSRQRLEAVTLQAAWLIPYRDDLPWMIPAASLALLLPFYLASVAVEFAALAARWPTLARRKIIASVVVANALSYLGLGCYYGIELWSRLG
jgi:hypothetical protein